MALPPDGSMTTSDLTSGEFKSYLNNVISEIATGDTTYVSTRLYVKGAIVIGSDYYRYISQNNDNVGNDPLVDDGSNWRLDDTVINIFAALYTNGDQSVVGRLVVGVDVTDYDYLVYADNSGYTAWSIGSVTGTVSGDFNSVTGVDSGLTGALTKIEAITESRVSGIETQLNKSIAINFASDANLTLTSDQNQFGRINLTDVGGVLTGDVLLYVSDEERVFQVTNDTLQYVKVTTALGTGVHVPPSETYDLVNTGVNVETGKHNQIEVLPFSSYISGAYTYPNGLTQSNFESIIFYASNSENSELTKGKIDAEPTSWTVSVTRQAGVQANASYVSALSFTVNTVSFSFTQVIGTLKKGVTY